MNNPTLALLVAIASVQQPDRAAQNCFDTERGALARQAVDYYSCIQRETRRLEPSGADPESLFVASRRSCSPLASTLSRSAEICEGAFRSVVAPNWAARLSESVESVAREISVQETLEIRAARNRP
jgi:hypothetical protein